MKLDLAQEGLIASEILERDLLRIYLTKLEQIFGNFVRAVKAFHDPVSKAKALFSWLWQVKPRRYRPHGPYRLNEVIDAQLDSESEVVGNCLGLTLLYHCLLRKGGIMAEAVHLESAFGRGPHVLTLLQTEGALIDIENIFPDGFDYQEHLHNPSRIHWGSRELVADLYLSVGNELFERGELGLALKNYDKAVHWNPNYEKARLNQLILWNKMREEKERKGN